METVYMFRGGAWCSPTVSEWIGYSFDDEWSSKST